MIYIFYLKHFQCEEDVRCKKLDRPVTILSRLWARRPGLYFVHGKCIYFLATASRLALGSTQPPVRCVPGLLSSGVKV
jgi:hypothetical protein